VRVLGGIDDGRFSGALSPVSDSFIRSPGWYGPVCAGCRLRVHTTVGRPRGCIRAGHKPAPTAAVVGVAWDLECLGAW